MTGDEMQQIKDGYRKTEIGVLPQQWQVVKISDIAPFIANGFVGAASRYYTKDESAAGYIMGKNIRANKIEAGSLIRINKEFVAKYPKTKIFAGDMLTIQSGHAGISCIVTKEFDNSNCHAVIISRFNRELACPDYLAYYLNSFHGKTRLKRIFVGTTMNHLNTKDLKLFRVPLPPLLEQQRIAEILIATDAHLEKLDAVIKDMQLLKKAMIEKLLTRGIGHTEFKDSEIGSLPKAWEVVTLKEITHLVTKGTTPSTVGFDYEAKGVNFIKVENIDENGNINISSTSKITAECNQKLRRSAMQEHDILVSIAGTIGKSAIVKGTDLPANTNQAVAIIRLKSFNSLDKNYLNFIFSSNYFYDYIKSIGTAGAQPNINLKQLKNFIFPLPDIVEQKNIAKILLEFKKSLDFYGNARKDFIELKTGLMEQLLTGKIRLK